MSRIAAIGVVAAAIGGFAIAGTDSSNAPAAVDKDCSDFTNQAQAQSYFVSNGAARRTTSTTSTPTTTGWRASRCRARAPLDPAAVEAAAIRRQRRVKVDVIEAVDGDTLSVRLRNGDQRDVRLIGIDTPETVRPDTPVQCGGPQASASMHGLADGRRVTLVSDPTQDRVDTYGRLLDYVFRGGENLGKVQLRRGWAKVYVYHHHPFEKVRTFKHAEDRAESADRGVWAKCGGDFHTPG